MSDKKSKLDIKPKLVYRTKPNPKKRKLTLIWQFLIVFLVGAVIVAGVGVAVNRFILFNQITSVIQLALVVLLVYELYLVVSGRTTLIDKAINTRYGKILFWVFFCIFLVTALYVPQKWGEWTNETKSFVPTKQYLVLECLAYTDTDSLNKEQLEKYCDCTTTLGIQEYGIDRYSQYISDGGNTKLTEISRNCATLVLEGRI